MFGLLKCVNFEEKQIMASEIFFKQFDNEIETNEKAEKQRQQKTQHYRELTEVFVKKLKPVLKPYVEGLEKRGFSVEENDNGAYYNLRVKDVMKGKDVQIGTTHSPYGGNDNYFVLSDFEEYGRQMLAIDETFPKEKIITFIENTFKKLV